MNRRLLALVALCVSLFLAMILLASRVFADSCPAEGDGGDPELNELKNRVDVPKSPASLTAASVVAMHEIDTKRARSTWTRAQARLVHDSEGAGVFIEGYLVGAKEEGPESANCHVDDHADHDFHVFIADSADDPKSKSVVVEVTPRVRASHASWTIAAVRSLVRTRARVRVTGWLMYDQEHYDETPRYKGAKAPRGSSWEIHPITAIDVYRDGRWSAL